MPYNVDKKVGGDSKENTGWMERCVTKVMEGGKSKSSAIAICKAQLSKNKTSDSSVTMTFNVLAYYDSTYCR